MKQVVLIHGWEGSPQREWFPWLRRALENKGYEVIAPALPDPAHPKLDAWLGEIERAAGKIDESVVFVGHSLGAITAVQFIAKKVKRGTAIGGAVFVAGFSGRIFEPQIAEFYDPDLDVAQTMKDVKRRVVIYSDTDDYVPVETSKRLAAELGAEEIFLPNRGHFSEDDGAFEFPELLEAIETL